MCDHVVRGKTMDEKLNNLKMLCLSIDPLPDVMLDRHDSRWNLLTWFIWSEKVTPTNARISQLETELTTGKAEVTTAKAQLHTSKEDLTTGNAALTTANTELTTTK